MNNHPGGSTVSAASASSTEANLVRVRKSNQFVTAKFKTSIIGNKIVAISLTKLERDGNQYRAVLYPGEIRRVLGVESDTNIYKKLKNVAKTLAGHIIQIEDGNGNFQTFNMITNADYIDHKFVITYNKEMGPYITDLKKNYTSFNLSTLVSFTRNSSYRLYEILKKEAWRLNESPTGELFLEYSVNELRAMIGLINTDSTYISAALKEHNNDWDYIVEHVVKPDDIQYSDYHELSRRVLKPAQEEIAEKSDICFTYKPIRYGSGARVRKIQFCVTWNANRKEEVIDQIRSTTKAIASVSPEYVRSDLENQKHLENEKYQELLAFLHRCGITDTEDFTFPYFKRLSKAANGNMAVIREEIEYSRSVSNIENYYGWLTEAVKNRYSRTIPVATVYGSSELPRKAGEIMKDPISSSEKEQVWERYKKKPEFPAFLLCIDLDLEMFEELYSLEERMKLFTSFLVSGKVSSLL